MQPVNLVPVQLKDFWFASVSSYTLRDCLGVMIYGVGSNRYGMLGSDFNTKLVVLRVKVVYM